MHVILVHFSCSTSIIEDNKAGVSQCGRGQGELSLEILLVNELINDPGLKREKTYESEGFRTSGG